MSDSSTTAQPQPNADSSVLLQSPIADRHEGLGAKFAEFGGWSMPLQYAGILSEHRACRGAAAVFDVSHLGKINVTGPGAVEFLNTCLSNDLNRIQAGQAQYSLVCDAGGGVIDDLIAYRKADDEVFLVPNAANTARVAQLLQAAAPPGVQVENRHRDYGVLAVQGPNSGEILAALGVPTGQDYMCFEQAELSGAQLTVCRTGYTGEHGYELVVGWNNVGRVWDELLATGAGFGLVPAGLGARDTLRTEMGYALHGHELSESITGLQAGVSWAIGWKKPDFWGASALRQEKTDGPKHRLHGLVALGRGIPRPGMTVVDAAEARPLGAVTSGTFSPTLEKGIALALLDVRLEPGSEVGVEVRGRLERFQVTPPPFVTSKVR